MKTDIVVKIGGSILYDPLLNINFELFKKVKKWYWESKKKYNKIVLVTGGGGLSRSMEEKISENIGGNYNLHNIAMSLTQTNATLLASYLEDKDIYIPKKLGDAYEYLNSPDVKYMISGGLKIGWSTDMDAAVFADVLGVDRVYKVSNIDHVYDKDPKAYFDSKAIKDLTWDQYFKLFKILKGQEHKPNTSIPVDVQCSQFCLKKNLSFHITGGKLLNEDLSLREILKEGTFIHP